MRQTTSTFANVVVSVTQRCRLGMKSYSKSKKRLKEGECQDDDKHHIDSGEHVMEQNRRRSVWFTNLITGYDSEAIATMRIVCLAPTEMSCDFC